MATWVIVIIGMTWIILSAFIIIAVSVASSRFNQRKSGYPESMREAPEKPAAITPFR